jgi:hypothetical protein
MKNIVVVDIDGTLSKIGDRLEFLKKEPKDWDSFYKECYKDEPISDIIDLVKALLNSGRYFVIYCTGRRESTLLDTSTWLFQQGLSHSHIHILMRKNDDHRHDTEVKPELLAEAHFTPDNVAFILEDRNSMVKKWRELGFTCLQVADGDF